MEWGKTFAHYISDKGLVIRIYSELLIVTTELLLGSGGPMRDISQSPVGRGAIWLWSGQQNGDRSVYATSTPGLEESATWFSALSLLCLVDGPRSTGGSWEPCADDSELPPAWNPQWLHEAQSTHPLPPWPPSTWLLWKWKINSILIAPQTTEILRFTCYSSKYQFNWYRCQYLEGNINPIKNPG